jgi:hypothetical protein
MAKGRRDEREVLAKADVVPVSDANDSRLNLPGIMRADESFMVRAGAQ